MEASMKELKEAQVQPNQVWAFRFKSKKEEHFVQVGDYFTCTCYKDDKCPYFCLICQRIFSKNAKELKKENFISVRSIGKVKCTLCYVKNYWENRGIDYSFCVKCVGILCNNCAIETKEKCPWCREPNYLSRTFTSQEKNKEMESDLNSLKTNDSLKNLSDSMNIEESPDPNKGPEDFDCYSDYDEYCEQFYEDDEEPPIIKADLNECKRLWGFEKFIC